MATRTRTLEGTVFFTIMLVMSVGMMISPCHAQLSPTFYDKTCPNALDTIRASINSAVSKETRMAASLLRLHFHDCIVQGCDASILLTDGGERRTTLLKNRSLRGFEVVEKAKGEVEKICPGVVSCADIVAVAARDATVAVGGPSWKVKLGRRDSTASADEALADMDLPAFNSSLDALISLFKKKGLSTRDMVALSGAHTLGLALCISYRDRIYSNGTDIDAGFASALQRDCPLGGTGLSTAPLDLVTPGRFDNNYFKILMQKKGLLPTDQALFNGSSTDSIVSEYAGNPAKFMSDFAAAMIRMGDIEPLTGGQGQVRKICSVAN